MAVLLNLREGINERLAESLICFGPGDIHLLRKAERILVKHFGRPWTYAGAEKPHPVKEEVLEKVDALDIEEGEKLQLKKLLTEKEMPMELVLVLEGGDPENLHHHNRRVPAEMQMEQYVVPEGEVIEVDLDVGGKIKRLAVSGPSILFLGKEEHRREKGECFVVKFPSGNFKEN